jgi:integrase
MISAPSRKTRSTPTTRHKEEGKDERTAQPIPPDPRSVDDRAIVAGSATPVKPGAQVGEEDRDDSNDHKRRTRKKRRQSHGSAWHWKQTDGWYYTLPGTKKRVPLFDEDGLRIGGVENKKAAQLALARVKVSNQWQPITDQVIHTEEWLVAKVCSEYLQYCERGVANKTVSKGHRDGSVWVLNDFCRFCGALPVAQLKKGHVKRWIESHEKWKSPATHRSVIAIVLAAFNHAQENHDVPNPLKGLKKPSARPRLLSFAKEDEEALYGATDEPFRNFLFAAIHTGLRPYCELAKLTADDVEEVPRGMMWRVYSSKTKKTRKIPVRTEVAALTRRLIETAPRGSGRALFRNNQGNPWKKVTGVARFLGIKRKLGWDRDPIRKGYCSYICRHTFAHRMLSGYWNGDAGCSIETLAELIGDTPKVAFDHYGKEWGQHYQDPLWAAIGAPGQRGGQQARRPRHVGRQERGM